MKTHNVHYILCCKFIHKDSSINTPETFLSNSMEQSPSGEADGHSAIEEIPRILLTPNVYYRVHKGQQFRRPV